MYVLAVTGGIGSGKSTAARLFGERGAVVIDLDDMAKALIGPGGPLAEPVATAFGRDLLADEGGIDNARLAAIAFASPESARKLDAIVHPGVLAATQGALDMLDAQESPPAVVVIDIPLLVEAPGFFEVVDSVLAISADEDMRLARLAARGMGEDDARARMDAQATDAERREIADWVLDNDGSLESFRHTLSLFWEREVAPRVA
ncbi:MAG: dephospho-CoA kinase [Coriobacteriia bacterium]|nr:dephospho-CoA kinase [Coriobacteriia bacterium]